MSDRRGYAAGLGFRPDGITVLVADQSARPQCDLALRSGAR
ncbi:hypothetical protein [Streptomyces phaeoluteigriseus]